MERYSWTGPLRVGDLLAGCLTEDHPWPPDSRAIYLVSQRPWTARPTRESGPLYVGGNTGGSSRFVTRVGDLVADMHGLYGESTGHHSGGQALYTWCSRMGVHPGDLYIAWAHGWKRWCGRCAEIEILRTFLQAWDERGAVGLLNKYRPPWCKQHDKWMP